MKSAILLLLVLLVASCSDEGTNDPLPPTAYDEASASKGGISYDKFWSAESGFDQTDPNIAVFSAKADFFRCKQCHAWDRLGTSGSYISRGPKATRPNVSDLNLFQHVQSKTPQELFDGMKKTADRRDVSYDLSTYDPATNSTIGDQMPNLSQIMSDAQIWDIVKFLKADAIDVTQLYDATYTGTYPTGTAQFSNVGKDGNAASGKAFFATNCAQCHGATGEMFTIEDMTVGQFTRNKPNEVQHKVKYGQLGTGMTGEFDITTSQMRDMYKALANSSDFPDK